MATPPLYPKSMIILDPGLSSYLGHHYMFDVRLTREAQRNGFSCRVFGGLRLLKNVEMEQAQLFAHFTDGPYPEAAGVVATETKWEELNSRCLQDVKRCGADRLREQDVLVCHTFRSAHLLGLARWLLMNATQLRCRVIVYLLCAEIDDNGVRGTFITEAIETFANAKYGRLEFLAETDRIRSQFSARSNHKLRVGLGPIVDSRRDLITPKLHSSVDLLRVGYFGHSKIRKGFLLLPSIVDSLARSELQIKFTIQLVAPRYDAAALAKLRLSLTRHENVDLIEGVMSEARYNKEFASCDIILLPYSQEYMDQGSGLLAESLAGAKLLVLPDYCNFETILAPYQAPAVYFSTWNTAAIATGLTQAVTGYGEKSSQLIRAARKFNEERGFASLFNGEEP